jgi:arylsulfatase A-like enzyme
MDLEKYLITEEGIRRKARLENEINRRVFERLEKFSRPFFLWVHYMDTHYPYLPQPEAQRAAGIPFVSREENFRINSRVRENAPLSSERIRQVQNLYDAAVRQLDSKVGELFEFLQRRGWFDSSLMICCADHGEEFLEHGDLQHKSKLFDELLRVPLLIKPPFCARCQRRGDLVALIDLAPTIFALLELQNPFNRRSFLPPPSFSQDGNFVIAEASYAPNGGPPVDRQLFNIEVLPKRYAYRDRFWKLIFDTKEEKPVLYNLLSDPFENMPLRESSGPAGLRAILEHHIKRQERNRLRAKITRVRKKLRSAHHEENFVSP